MMTRFQQPRRRRCRVTRLLLLLGRRRRERSTLVIMRLLLLISNLIRLIMMMGVGCWGVTIARLVAADLGRCRLPDARHDPARVGLLLLCCCCCCRWWDDHNSVLLALLLLLLLLLRRCRTDPLTRSSDGRQMIVTSDHSRRLADLHWRWTITDEIVGAVIARVARRITSSAATAAADVVEAAGHSDSGPGSGQLRQHMTATTSVLQILTKITWTNNRSIPFSSIQIERDSEPVKWTFNCLFNTFPSPWQPITSKRLAV